MQFAADFSSFKINSETDKYLSNTFNLLLLVRQDETSGSEIKNGNEKNIENLFNFNQKLGLCFFASKRGL